MNILGGSCTSGQSSTSVTNCITETEYSTHFRGKLIFHYFIFGSTHVWRIYEFSVVCLQITAKLIISLVNDTSWRNWLANFWSCLNTSNLKTKMVDKLTSNRWNDKIIHNLETVPWRRLACYGSSRKFALKRISLVDYYVI